MMDPTDPDWWYKEVRERSMSRRAKYLPYDGQYFVAILFGFVIAALLFVIISEDYGPVYTAVISFTIGILAVMGFRITGIFSWLYDSYHHKFHTELKKLINEIEASNKGQLQNSAGQLSGIVGNLSRDEAEEKLRACSEELANQYIP